MLNVEGPVIMHMDKPKALRILRRRCLCMLPFCLIMFTLLSVSQESIDSFTNILRWCLLLEVPVLYVLVARYLVRTSRPILSFSSLGITVDILGNRAGFLRWDEIKEIYIYKFGESFVGITLHDPKTVYARMGLKGSLIPRLSALVAPFYKPFRIRIAPISIPLNYLNVSADELLAQIKTYQSPSW